MSLYLSLAESLPLSHTVPHLSWSETVGCVLAYSLWIGAFLWLPAAAFQSLSRSWSSHLRYHIAVACFLLQLLAVPLAWIAIQSANAPQVASITVEHDTLLLGAKSLTVCWLVGVAILAVGLIGGLWKAFRLPQHSRVIDNHRLKAATHRLCRQLGIRRPVAVTVSELIRSPIMIGIVRPCIVVPAHFLTGWSLDRVEFILLHELIHIVRRDNLVTLLQRVTEMLLFFQPAVWSISRWIDEEREFCCDDAVLRMTGRSTDYAETLMALASVPRRRLESIPASHAGRPPIKSRLERILFPEEQPMSSRPLGLSAFVTLVAFVGGSFGLLQNSSAAEPVTAALSSSGLQSGIATADVNLESSGATVVHPTEVIPIITKSEFNSIITTQFLSGIGQIDAGKRSWGPEQVIGEPDTEGAGDIITAWASLSPDDQDEWLILQYERTINAKIVEIHETYNPGAVVKVTAFNADGEEVVAWEGDDPTPTTEDRGISIIPIDIDFETDRIKVYIASTVVPGWNEIDAVGLHDKNGDVLWAVNVECSSTYADPFSPVTVTSYANYGPEQAAGEPNTLVAGDAPTAWASATADGQEEWLLCHYDELIIPESVAVHETSAPGALSKVSVFNDGEEVVVWEGEDPTPADEPQGISVIPIDIDFEIDTVKLYFDSVNVPGWNEIDAVGLRSTAGETQWASTVEASSTYDSNIAFVDTLPLAPYVDPNVMALQNEVEALRSEVESLRSDLEEIKQLLRNRLNDEDPIEEN